MPAVDAAAFTRAMAQSDWVWRPDLGVYVNHAARGIMSPRYLSECANAVPPTLTPGDQWHWLLHDQESVSADARPALVARLQAEGFEAREAQQAAAPGVYTLLIDRERYHRHHPVRAEWPASIVVHGTLEQARFVADELSLYEAGCDGYWYVVGDEG